MMSTLNQLTTLSFLAAGSSPDASAGRLVRFVLGTAEGVGVGVVERRRGDRRGSTAEVVVVVL